MGIEVLWQGRGLLRYFSEGWRVNEVEGIVGEIMGRKVRR
jgi:hypothetical protein